MEAAVILGVISIPLWLNAWAAKAVICDNGSEKRQKITQLLFVWLIPLVSAVIALAIHHPDEARQKKHREPPDPGDDFGLSGRETRGLQGALDDD